MTTTNLWLCVSLCFISFHGADGFLNYDVSECVFNSTDLKDIQYTRSWYYNKLQLVRFDSRVGQYVGYTECGMKQADYFNSLPGYMDQLRGDAARYCKHNAENEYPNALDKRVEPYVRVTSEKNHRSRHTHMLVCSSYSFYPKQILVTWLRDEEPITSDVSSTDELPDGDWYYQYHAYLEYTPRSGEKISCMVEHPSLTEPIFVHWDDSMPESEKNKLAIGASGLVLGLVLFLSGFIYLQWKKRGRILVPTSNL